LSARVLLCCMMGQTGTAEASRHGACADILDSCPPALGPWADPGGDADSANPWLSVPKSVRVLDEGNAAYWMKHGGGGDISDAEIDWMAQQRELVFSLPQLVLDYGEAEAAQIDQALESADMSRTVAGALAWPGVATRWRRFFAWWRALAPGERPVDAKGALAAFGRAVGRVRTFRALALDSAGLRRILREDEIFPSGRLRHGVDAASLRGVVSEHGVAKVAVVRLFISHMPKIGGIDPSISLHDDWQTTSLIASGYATASKRVHLFELSVPAIESLGWTLQEVAHRSGPYLGPKYAEHEPWFCFPSPGAPAGTWFDATLQRTERYGLFSVPHLRKRLRRLYRFDSAGELGNAVAPFVADMALRHDRHPDGQVTLSTAMGLDEGSLTARLLSGELLDVDFSGVSTAAEARRRIARYLETHTSQVHLLRRGTELSDEARLELEELGVVIVKGYRYNERNVTKIIEPGVNERGDYCREWLIEYAEDGRSSDCTEETAKELIKNFNFKRCTKVVDFFWHGHIGKQECHYYLPQEVSLSGESADPPQTKYQE